MLYSRAGILPYIIDNKKRYYLFGVDRDYLTLMDFGGHREANENSPILTSLREMKEESNSLISSSMIRHIEEPIILKFKHSYNYEYLMHLNLSLADLSGLAEKFAEERHISREKDSQEHISLTIMEEGDVINTLKYGKNNFYPIITSTLLELTKI